MIFDGPFSDSLYNKEIKGLTDVEVNKETAQKNLEAIFADFYSYDKIEYKGETKGNFVTYDFSVYVNNKIITVMIYSNGTLFKFPLEFTCKYIAPPFKVATLPTNFTLFAFIVESLTSIAEPILDKPFINVKLINVRFDFGSNLKIPPLFCASIL